MCKDDTGNKCRFGVIEVRYRTVGKLAMYDLTINGRLWACVEWSPSRRGWCIQDGSGRCLSHCDAVHGQDIDVQTAIKLAKAMIRDGRIPCPEEAHEQLAERLRQDRQSLKRVPMTAATGADVVVIAEGTPGFEGLTEGLYVIEPAQPLGEPMEILKPREEPVVVEPKGKRR